MILVLLIFLSYWGVDASDKIHLQSPRYTNYGTWHDWKRCPDGEYVHGMQIKFEGDQRGGDDTALNAVSLYCQQIGYDGFRNDHWIMSGEGEYGEWQGIKWCPRGTVGIGFALRSEPDQRGRDDVGADNFALYCGRVNGPRNKDSWVQGDTAGWGEWTADQFCPDGYVVCGIQSQIEGRQGGGDDTSLNNVNVECCSVSGGASGCNPNYQFVKVGEYDNRGGAGTVSATYSKRVSFTKTSSTAHMVSNQEKKSITNKVSTSAGISYEVPVKTGKMSASGSITYEHTSGRETINTDQLTTMVQDAMTNERSESVTFTVPAFTRVWIEQLVLFCGDVRVGLWKTVSKSD